jgi:hypothetical protein
MATIPETTVSTPDFFLKLTTLKPIEPKLTWEEFCSDPMLLFKAFADIYIVDASELKSNVQIIKSATTPPAGSRTAIWVKTSWPYAIGVFVDGKYQMNYGMTGYPVDIPFLKKDKDMLPPLKAYVSKLTDNEIAAYGFQNTTGSDPEHMSWYMFSPPPIELS